MDEAMALAVKTALALMMTDIQAKAYDRGGYRTPHPKPADSSRLDLNNRRKNELARPLAPPDTRDPVVEVSPNEWEALPGSWWRKPHPQSTSRPKAEPWRGRPGQRTDRIRPWMDEEGPFLSEREARVELDRPVRPDPRLALPGRMRSVESAHLVAAPEVRAPVSRVLARANILEQVPRWQQALERLAEMLRNAPR